jgi:hypothetical protein
MSTPPTPEVFGIGGRQKPHHRATTDPYLDPAGVDQFVAGMTRLRDDWPSLDQDERLERIDALINPRLAATGVPAVEVEIHPDRTDGATFGFKTWSIRLGSNLVQAPQLDVNATAWLANVVYHEGRHAQQWYDMARTQAGDGKTAAEMAQHMGIPLKVAKTAARDPLRPNATGVEGARRHAAQTHHRSVYDHGPNGHAKHRNHVLGELNRLPAERNQKHAAYWQAVATHGQHPTTTAGHTALTQAYQDWWTADQNYQQHMPTIEAAYRNLPEEVDAWTAGNAVGHRSHRHQTHHPPRAPTITATPVRHNVATHPSRSAHRSPPANRRALPHQRPPATRAHQQPGRGR